MDRELRYLLLTKVGFLLAVVPWIAVAIVGTVSGLGASVVLLSSLAGAALWGFSYGVLHEKDDD